MEVSIQFDTIQTYHQCESGINKFHPKEHRLTSLDLRRDYKR